jgi:hypothetical protein
VLEVTDTDESAATDSQNVIDEEVKWEEFPGTPKHTAVTDPLAEMLYVQNLSFRSRKA